jgi:DNA-directed RNA polymerase subunit RPC12/RpoP
MEIAFECDKCGQSLVVDEAGAGMTVTCPQCSQSLLVPSIAKEKATPQRVSTAPPPPRRLPPPPPLTSSNRPTGYSPPASQLSEPTSVPKLPQGANRSIETFDKFWHYTLNGERHGPVTEDNIRKLLTEGRLNNEAFVWTEGFQEWLPISKTKFYIPAGKLPRLSDCSNRPIHSLPGNPTPPPLTGAAVNNKVIWIATFTPIWGGFLVYLIAKATDSNPKNLWFCWPILNGILCLVDEHILENAGHNTKKFSGLFAWLIPVYLFKRARALKQSLSYFIVWIVCWIVSLFLYA